MTELVSANEHPANSFLVQGFLENKDIRISSDNNFFYETSLIPFEVYVLDCQWQIKLGTRNPKVFDYCIVSSDGEDCYLLFNYETRLKNAASQKILLPDNIGDGTVTKGMTPRFTLANEAGVLWLAYASDCFFQKQASSRVPVPFTVYVRPQPILTGRAVIEETAS